MSFNENPTIENLKKNQPISERDPGDETDYYVEIKRDEERVMVSDVLEVEGQRISIKPAMASSGGRYRHPSSQRFHDILHELGVLHDRKAQDYGVDEDPLRNVRNSGDFGVPAWVGCMIRANDKMKRIQSFANKGSLMNESLQDSLLDLAVYSVIALVLLEEES